MKVSPVSRVMFCLHHKQPSLLYKDSKRKIYPATQEGLKEALDEYQHEVDVVV